MIFYKETKFQETSIGRFPKEWNVVILEDICEKVRAGGTPLTSKKEYWNGDLPFVKIEDITLAGKYLTATKSFISKEGLSNSNAWLVPENSLLFAMYGSMGEVSINKIPVTTNQAILGIIPKDKDDAEFLYYWFSFFKPRWRKYAKPTTQANLTAEIVRNSMIPLPSKRERQEIAKVLGVVDSVIAKTGEVIAKTERLKKGLMQELLTRGIGHKEFKETEIGKIPKTWQIVSLGDVCEQRSEIVQPSANNMESFVGLEHVASGETRLRNFAQSIDVKSTKFRFYAGDILYGKLRPYLDKAVLADLNGICSTDLLVLKPKGNVIKEFLIYILHSTDFIKHAIATTTGTNHPRTSWAAISRFKFSLPERSEQQNIANILSAIDMKLELEKKEKVMLERIKRGLMDLLLTGKIRIKVD